MTYEGFESKLKELKLDKKDFAKLTGMSYTSVTNWKQNTRVASWVSSWLTNYEKALILDKITKAIKPFV